MLRMDLDSSNAPEDSSRQTISIALAEVYHDVNNPLAVIAGNAQLLLEIARAMNLDEHVLEPIEDIEAASERIRVSLRELEVLKNCLRARAITREAAPAADPPSFGA